MSEIEVFTIGHSNHTIERFIGLLEQHKIHALVDIRRFPSSRRYPHFNRPNLAEALAEHGIEYHWLESLGGHRKVGLADSPNFAIRDESFRNYADHMFGDEFRQGADRLLEIAKNMRVVTMCAESSFHQCHRKLLGDFLLANGVRVQHILPSGDLQPHKLSDGAKVENGKVTYPESHPLFDANDG